MLLYRLLSRLLDYPDRELYENLSELRAITETDTSIDAGARSTLKEFLCESEAKSLTEWQEEYVNTFDLKQDNSLHLTHHTYGEERGRGPALIELDEHYKTYGYEVDGKRELPDFLPLILEYVSTLDVMEANWFLGQMKRVLQLLVGNLEIAASPYAKLVALVEAQATIMPHDATSENLAEGGA